MESFMSFENAFYQKQYSSVFHAFSYGLNEQCWRWGLVFNQGNDWSVSQNRVQERLRYIRSNLLRAIFGNRYRGKGSIRFLVFKHGSLESFNQHWHVLMAIDGDRPDWDDLRVEMKIYNIVAQFIRSAKSEKLVHIDREWREGNRYHSYVSRYAQSGTCDDYFVM
jgi:hypothetical protein